MDGIIATLIETSPASITVHDFKGNFLYANQKTLDLHGYSKEEFLRLKLRDIDVPESAALIQSRIDELQERGEAAFEVEHFRKDRTKVPLLVTIKQAKWGDRNVILSTAIDITRQKRVENLVNERTRELEIQNDKLAREIAERKRVEDALRESEARLKDAQTLGQIGSWVFDIPSLTLKWSEQTFKLYERDPALGPPTPEEEERYYPASQVEKVREIARVSMEEGRGAAYDLEIELPGGRTKFFSAIMQPIKDTDGRVVKLFGTVQDMTERKKIEQERQELLEKTLQISDLKSNLITQAAHELKTPLTAILGWGSLLLAAKKQGKGLNADSDLEGLESIARNAARLDDLINDFLDVGRIESGKLEITRTRVDFNEILSTAMQAVDFLANQRGATISMNTVPSPDLALDHQRMEQALINLLSNAIKYSPEHGRITVKTKMINVSGHLKFQVQVIDEGYGFTAEELAEATTPFGKAYTRQEQKRAVQGTGLGLFISRRIVEQHGGTLTIRSEGANKGTEVEILLPLGG